MNAGTKVEQGSPAEDLKAAGASVLPEDFVLSSGGKTIAPPARDKVAYLRVLLDDSRFGPLVYSAPADASLRRGARVRVPLRSRTSFGTVLEALNEPGAEGVRPVTEVLDERFSVPERILNLAEWVADYYCCPLDAAIRSVIPQVVRGVQLDFKTARIAVLIGDAAAAETLEQRAPAQAAALRRLAASGGRLAAALLRKETGLSTQGLRSLIAKGLVSMHEETVRRDPAGEFLPAPVPEMNAEQRAAYDLVIEALDTPAGAAPILLQGVTGSGKTEVYLRSIEAALERGLGAIVLVPEISLTPQTVERFKSRFSQRQNEVAVLHSHLSDGERHDEWMRIRSGEAKMVIGARSAVFAPVANLGLIVVDEEHETSYKQEELPRYNARDIAVVRGRLEEVVVLLGSATPSLESAHNARLGKYRLSLLSKRVDSLEMPPIRIVDLRQQRGGGESALAAPLRIAIEDRLAKGQQVILFLNRRGFASAMVCPTCGHVEQCPHCSVAMTYHRDTERLACHLCGHTARPPLKCRECGFEGVRQAGIGTQKVEEQVRRLFPQARIARLDTDSMTRKHALRDTLGAFKAGKIDILVGTQMIAKGLHFPNVTLVGIVNADLSLHLPDFRAGERTFQLLTQVAGRAGRGEASGEVFVQTFSPFHPSIQFARHHDYDGFVDQEMEFRERLSFPPYVHMTLITVLGSSREKAEFTAQTLLRQIAPLLPPKSVAGEPAPAPIERIRDEWRYHIVLRSASVVRMNRAVHSGLEKLTLPDGVRVQVDIDPFRLL